MGALLNEEDVFKVAKKLEKMSKNEVIDAAAVTEQIKLLRNFKMSLDILQKTRIGLIINAIRKKSTDSDCSQQAKGLIRSWKKLLPSSGGNVDGEAEEDGGQSEQVNEDSNPEPEKKSIENRSNGKNGSVGLSKQISASSASSQGDPTRQKCENMLLEALRTGINEDNKGDNNCEAIGDERLASLATELENAIYTELRKTDDRYKNRVRSRVMNLRDKKNRQLRQAYAEGAISAEQLAKMTAEEMASDEMKKLRERFTKESINDAQMAFSGGTSTTHIKCNRCGKSDCTYNQVQTRSADEPMTTFVLCNNCGRRWKFC